jgi:hypothetical protein
LYAGLAKRAFVSEAGPEAMAYSYDGGPVWADRIEKAKDHCGSAGPVFELSTLIVGGTIRNPADRTEALSTKRTGTPSTSRVLIYAVDGKYQINVAVDGVRGSTHAVKHETLFHNAEVLAAGEMDVIEGTIIAVNDHSGTYVTHGLMDLDPTFSEAVLTALDRIGAPIDPRERRRLESKAGER